MKLAPTRPFPAVWGQRIAYCNVSALLVVATDIRGTLLASVPRVWSSPMCVWMRWAVTRAPKKACHEMSEKGPFWGQLKVKAPSVQNFSYCSCPVCDAQAAEARSASRLASPVAIDLATGTGTAVQLYEYSCTTSYRRSS
jgi:hypothetical protein